MAYEPKKPEVDQHKNTSKHTPTRADVDVDSASRVPFYDQGYAKGTADATGKGENIRGSKNFRKAW